jgi:hypothetical protein
VLLSRRDEQNMQMIDILSKQISSLSKENERLKRWGESTPPTLSWCRCGCDRNWPVNTTAVTKTANTAVTPENAATESPDSATVEIPDSTETANSAEATNETGVAIALPPAKKTKTSAGG